jgi:organic hydroperoxide reductase OsmC/OhrA
MQISATLKNTTTQNHIIVETNGNQKEVHIPVKENGQGSSINGGELLFLALATCFCNDLHREASRRDLTLQSISVRVTGDFGKEGESASNIKYEVDIKSPHAQDVITKLIKDVDNVAEVHNTLRKGVAVALVG